jgi:hypothetical protein
VRPDHISLTGQLGLHGTGAQDAMTKCHGFGDLGNRTLSPQGSVGWNYEVKVCVGWVPSGGGGDLSKPFSLAITSLCLLTVFLL